MPRRDERVDEGLIHAWLDGELDAVEAARVERLVAEDAEWAAAAAEARGLIAASSRILGALDVVAGDVIPRGGSAAGPVAPGLGESRVTKPTVARRGIVPTWMRIAAGFVLVAGVAYLGRGRGEMGSPPTVAGEVASDAASDAAAPARTAAPPVVASRVGQESKLIAAAKQNEADPSRREALSPVAAMLPPQERTTPAAVSAPAPAPTATTTATTSAAAARGVAGGVASPTVMRAATEPQAAAGAAAGVTAGAATVTADRELRAKSMQRAITATRAAEAERTADSPSALSALIADRAENAAALTTVAGCWRTQTTVRVDSIQIAPRVVRIAGDTLVLALTPAGAEARVLRESTDALTGTARDVSGRSAVFRAERIACTP